MGQSSVEEAELQSIHKSVGQLKIIKKQVLGSQNWDKLMFIKIEDKTKTSLNKQ